jgi:hypothetical protein
MDDKIMTLHPDPNKAGTNISGRKYDLVRQAIVDSTHAAGGEITFGRLTDVVTQRLQGSFDGSVPWYVVTVKLDLEARGVLARVPGASPQRLRLVDPQG